LFWDADLLQQQGNDARRTTPEFRDVIWKHDVNASREENRWGGSYSVEKVPPAAENR